LNAIFVENDRGPTFCTPGDTVRIIDVDYPRLGKLTLSNNPDTDWYLLAVNATLTQPDRYSAASVDFTSTWEARFRERSVYFATWSESVTVYVECTEG
jgi:hypothetical protein